MTRWLVKHWTTRGALEPGCTIHWTTYGGESLVGTFVERADDAHDGFPASLIVERAGRLEKLNIMHATERHRE